MPAVRLSLRIFSSGSDRILLLFSSKIFLPIQKIMSLNRYIARSKNDQSHGSIIWLASNNLYALLVKNDTTDLYKKAAHVMRRFFRGSLMASTLRNFPR